MNITEEQLLSLREKIKSSEEISEKRRVHTLAVEDMAVMTVRAHMRSP